VRERSRVRVMRKVSERELSERERERNVRRARERERQSVRVMRKVSVSLLEILVFRGFGEKRCGLRNFSSKEFQKRATEMAPNFSNLNLGRRVLWTHQQQPSESLLFALNSNDNWVAANAFYYY
jgi:hypothetical protein